MEPPHHLRCLGPPALLAPNGEPIRFRTKKHLALLVYLAVESRRAHRRDRLASLLWPRVEIAEARHSLATALSILRPRLGLETLETSRDHVTVHPERISLDLDRLLARDILGTEATGLLDVASFLDGFDIPDAPEFAMWKDRQQARLLPTIKDALVVLIDRCRRTGDSRQIEQLADRMLALDELSEEAIRAKMEARALAGDRLTALKVFEEWRVKLEQELHATPTALVEQMAARMRRGGWERTVINDIPVASTGHGHKRAFVGRTREYAMLYECWVGLQQGNVAHSIVLGDSGVGKTTLVERLTTAAALEGASVTRAQSYDLERNIPFATLGGLIVGLLDRPGASATPPEALAELARTAPEVRHRFPTVPLPADTQGETARIRLTESFYQLLRAISEEHPVILVVDDMHLADEPSLAVLHLALRRATQDPILAIFTAHPAELRQSVQASILRESLRRLGGREVILAPLEEAESEELLLSFLPSEEWDLNPVVLRSLVNASGGFPMVLELLLQDWRTQGSNSLALALGAMTADFPSGADPTAAYGKILPRLAGRLEPATKSALDLAAVLGSRLNDLAMYSVIDLSLGQTMAALGRLSEVRVLREGTKGLEFANELIRAHVYTSVPSSVRKALHASIADRLQAAGEPASTLEVAWHTMRAGRVKDAIPQLLEGARIAIRYGAPQSAESALSSAIPSLHSEDLVEATFLLIQALQEQGRWRESLDACADLESRVSGEQSREVFAMAALAKAYLGASTSYELFELVPALKDTMRSSERLSTRILAARAAAQAIAPLRDCGLGEELLQILEQIPAESLDADSHGQLCLARALFMHQAGQPEASFQEANSALEKMLSRGEASAVVVQLRTGLGVIRSLQGRYEESAAHYERALQMANILGNDSLAGRIGANLALAYGRLGRYEEQLKCAEEASSMTEGEFAVWRNIQLAFSKATVYGMQGRIAKMREVIEALELQLGVHIPTSFIQRWLLWKSDALMVADLKVEAMKTARDATHGYQFKLETIGFAGAFARWTAITCIGTTAEPYARDVLRSLEEHLHDYDAMDQVEILCANWLVDQANGLARREMIAERLKRLPPCTATRLRALGIPGVEQNSIPGY
jgi:DNA-binding SARP family transcriptional activator/tetratricopeptide (TPR) repeat protein